MLLLIGTATVAGLSVVILYLKHTYSEDLRAAKIQEISGDAASENKKKKNPRIERYKNEIAKIMNSDPEMVFDLTNSATEKNIYEFKVDNQKFIMERNDKKNKANRKKEIVELAKTISENKLGPKFVGSSEDNGFFIMLFEGHEMTIEAVRDGAILREIGDKLRKTHDLAGNFTDAQTELQRAKKHYQNIIRKRNSIPYGLEAAFKKYEQEGKNMSHEQKGFCHANLSPDNIMKLDGNNILFTGWSNAGIGDQFEDLGYFAAYARLNTEQMRILMIGYLEGTEPSADVMKKLETYANRAVFLIALKILDSKRENLKKYDKKKLENLIAEPTIENLKLCDEH
ncbi:MAG: phosphotransferase [Holosporales bacterium]|jgi:thiamine kinase-like enzyme|nr:phosphotransferase [Holosporales bacterium]